MGAVEVKKALQNALLHGGVKLHYQPQVDISTGQTVGMEALARLTDPVLGRISPEVFIPIAEEAGLIHELGRNVLNTLQQEIPTLLAKHPELRVGINFSMHELAHPDFFTYLNQWLRDASTHIAQRLDIEVTESAFNQVPPQVVSGLNALRKLGIRVAIDDFGAGQSSLARLHTLPFDVIKLDKQFVQQLNQPIVSAIVKAMVQLAQQFNKTLIAEGVETLAQIQALKNLGCSLAQGFYYYEPQPLSYWLSNALHHHKE